MVLIIMIHNVGRMSWWDFVFLMCSESISNPSINFVNLFILKMLQVGIAVTTVVYYSNMKLQTLTELKNCRHLMPCEMSFFRSKTKKISPKNILNCDNMKMCDYWITRSYCEYSFMLDTTLMHTVCRLPVYHRAL